MRWETLTSPALNAIDRRDAVVVLPVGSVEQHGRHLPLGCDTMLAEAVAVEAARRADGVPPTLVLPPPWYGFSAHHMSLPGTVTLGSATVIALIKDICESVRAHGFRRVLLLNGHGGNVSILDVVANDLGHAWHGQARIATATYFRLVAHRAAEFRESAPGGMGHAGEFETSLMLHLKAELVHADRAATCYPDAGSDYLDTDLFGSRRAGTYLDFRDLSPTGTLGDPTLASAEKGARIFGICADEVLAFVRDFATWAIPEDRRAEDRREG